MELKTARLTILIDPNKKAAFERLCAQQDLTASQVIRQLIRSYLAQHGVEYVASGLGLDDVAAGGVESRRGGTSGKKKPSERDAAQPPRRATRRGA
jgi:hypothetical protein